jgi:hypothetical protein
MGVPRGSRSSTTTKGDEHARPAADPSWRAASRGVHEAAAAHSVPLAKDTGVPVTRVQAIIAEALGSRCPWPLGFEPNSLRFRKSLGREGSIPQDRGG